MAESDMRAIVLREHGGPEVMELRRVPRPVPAPGELLVRVHASGVNRADLSQRRGHYPAPPGWPADIPGLEYAGVVEATGAHTELFRSGDRVMGLVGGGGYAELLTVPERETVAVPSALDLGEAGAVPEAFFTAWDALVRQSGLSGGETVLVHAAGSGVGTAAIQIARAVGARSVGTSRTPEKLERAARLGLDHGILGGEDTGWAAGVLEATGGRGVDVVLDLVGAAYLEGNLRCLAPRGRWIVVGVPSGHAGTMDLRALMGRRASITGTVLRARPSEEKAVLARDVARRLSPLIEKGALVPVVERAYAPEEVAEAHRRMESNLNFGKLLIVWQ